MDSVRVRSTLGYLTAYLATVYLGRLTALEGTGLALFWPAAGVAALWLLRDKTRAQLVADGVLLVLSTVLLDLSVGLPLTASVLLGMANLVQSLVVRVVVAHVQRAPGGVPVRADLISIRGVVLLLGASVVAAVVGSPIGTTGGWVVSGNWTGESQIAWVIRNTSGIFVIAAAVLTGAATLRSRQEIRAGGGSLVTGEPRRHVRAELVALAVVSLVIAAAVHAPGQDLPLTFGVLVCSVWVGFRFTPVVGVAHTALLGSSVLAATMVGWGPMGLVGDLLDRANVMQAYLVITMLLVLLLALGVQERQALIVGARVAEAESSARADLLDAVTTAMTDGLLVVTADGQVTMGNPAAYALAATGSVDLTDPQVHGLRGIDRHPLESDELPHVRVLRGETVPPMDLLHRHPRTGKQSILSVTTAAMRHSSSPATAVLVIRDVTQERVREREIQAFAGVVAHDLRGPLGALKGTLEGCDEKLDHFDGNVAELRSNLIQMYGTADRMEHLILDLLSLAQAQSAPLLPEELDLDAVVDQVERELVAASSPRPPTIEHEALGSVVADPLLVRQLLSNLLANAVKYVAPGTHPQVRLESRALGKMVEVRVSDNGIGIPEEVRGRVFESFYRAVGGEYDGTGLGLAICAQAVERHGGRIEAAAGEHGIGTTISFTLPGTDQRERRSTSADPPPRRTGSETAVS